MEASSSQGDRAGGVKRIRKAISVELNQLFFSHVPNTYISHHQNLL